MKAISRRSLVRGLGLGALVAAVGPIVAACGPAAAPTAAPTKPAEKPAEKPAAAAAKPAEPTKPAAAPAQTPAAKPAAATKAATIRFLSHVTPEGTTSRDKAMKVIADRFAEKNPNTKVQFERIPWQEIKQKYMTAWEAGNATDLAMIQDTPAAVRQGSIENLSPFIESWPKAEVDDFYNKVVWERSVYEGKKYALQTFLHTYVAAYRKSVFDKAGVDVAKIATWDDFVKAGQAVTVDNNGKKSTESGFDSRNVKTWGWGTEGDRKGNWNPALGWLFTELNHPIVSEKDWKADWTSEAPVKAFTLVTDFIKKHKIQSLGDLSADLDTAENNFASGVYAATISYTNRLESVRTKMQYDWKDVAYLRSPTFDGKKPGPIATRVWDVGMNSKSPSKDAAWAFLTEYFSKEGDLAMVEPGGQMPMRTSNLSHPVLTKPEKAYVQVAKEGMVEWGYIEPVPPTPFGPHWVLAYHEVVSGDVPVQQALKKAEDEYHKLLKEATEK